MDKQAEATSRRLAPPRSFAPENDIFPHKVLKTEFVWVIIETETQTAAGREVLAHPATL